MRNKTNFIEDVKKVIKPDILTDDQIIEDAAHTMNQLKTTEYALPKDFTSTGKDEVFLFEQKPREATDGDGEVEDYFYLGKGE